MFRNISHYSPTSKVNCQFVIDFTSLILLPCFSVFVSVWLQDLWPCVWWLSSCCLPCFHSLSAIIGTPSLGCMAGKAKDTIMPPCRRTQQEGHVQMNATAPPPSQSPCTVMGAVSKPCQPSPPVWNTYTSKTMPSQPCQTQLWSMQPIWCGSWCTTTSWHLTASEGR